MFTHSYCTPELDVALNMGYLIIQVHEVLHWSETEMYDPVTKKGGLFTEYINTFLKLKQEASGYPTHIKTEEEKQAYIQEYLDHEGILLDKNSIVKILTKKSIKTCPEFLLWKIWPENKHEENSVHQRYCNSHANLDRSQENSFGFSHYE